MQVFSFLQAVLILKSSCLVKFHKYIAVIQMFLSQKFTKPTGSVITFILQKDDLSLGV